MLQSQGWQVSHGRVARLWRREGKPAEAALPLLREVAAKDDHPDVRIAATVAVSRIG